MSWSALPVSYPSEAASAAFNSMGLLLWEFHPEALLGRAWKEGRIADSINLPSTGGFPRLMAQLGRAGVPIAMDKVLNIWDFCGCPAGSHPERVKGSRPLQPGEVELVTALRRSAGQVIKMTNEQKSIMKLVFSGNAGHERKNTSARVAGAGTSCPFLHPIVFESPWHHPQWAARMALLTSTSLGFLVPLGAELVRFPLPLGAPPARGSSGLSEIGDSKGCSPPREVEFLVNL